MAPGLPSLDWSLVQAFLAVVDEGSLSGAARALGRSQPTIGRQIKAMEEQLGSELFHRHDKGLTLTQVGASVRAAAESMRGAAHQIELVGTGHSTTVAGTVRITASVAVATHHLPPILARLRESEPLIILELVPSNETSNLHFREADIAVRMYRPTQLDLVTAYLGNLELGVFAARSYVERRGVPREPADLLAHDVVGFDRETVLLEGFTRAGYPVDRDFFKVRCDDHAAHWALVRAGCGLGFGQLAIGRADPELVEVPLGLDLPSLPVWLTAHDVIRQAPRVQRVWNHLAEGLRLICSSHPGRDR